MKKERLQNIGKGTWKLFGLMLSNGKEEVC